jgi:hypothetical protein
MRINPGKGSHYAQIVLDSGRSSTLYLRYRIP